MTDDLEPAPAPELLVWDLHRSIAFWCGVCGCAIHNDCPEERFLSPG